MTQLQRCPGLREEWIVAAVEGLLLMRGMMVMDKVNVPSCVDLIV